MAIIYHGSSKQGLRVLEPKKSTHGEYVYATKTRMIAVLFGKRCGDDMVYTFEKVSSKDGFELIERVPFAFDKMYSNSSTLYSVLDDTFEDINTGFDEVVSSVSVPVIKEEYIPNLFDVLTEFKDKGQIKIYRFPNKPERYNNDDSDLFDTLRLYRDKLNRTITRKHFDRLLYLHPYLLEKTNDILDEFNIDYKYKKEDLVSIFSNFANDQLEDREKEQYVDCSYISIVKTYPEIKDDITSVYKDYLDKSCVKQK